MCCWASISQTEKLKKNTGVFTAYKIYVKGSKELFAPHRHDVVGNYGEIISDADKIEKLEDGTYNYMYGLELFLQEIFLPSIESGLYCNLEFTRH